MLRELAADALTEAGFLVFQAACGREALALLKRNPAIELLISDIHMPEMDGWTLVGAASKFRPDLKVLLMTGYAQPPHPEMAGCEILRKPFNLQTLCARARQVTGPVDAPNLAAGEELQQ